MMLFTHGNDDDEVSTILLDQKIIALKVDAAQQQQSWSCWSSWKSEE